MANHCINPCLGCGADLGPDGDTLCELCAAEAAGQLDAFAAAHAAWAQDEPTEPGDEAGTHEDEMDILRRAGLDCHGQP